MERIKLQYRNTYRNCELPNPMDRNKYSTILLSLVKKYLYVKLKVLARRLFQNKKYKKIS